MNILLLQVITCNNCLYSLRYCCCEVLEGFGEFNILREVVKAASTEFGCNYIFSAFTHFRLLVQIRAERIVLDHVVWLLAWVSHFT